MTQDFNEATPRFFHIMAKPTGPICNLNCSYCFYLEKEKLYPAQTHWAMSDEVVESFVRQYIQAQTAPVITFSWQGGEPTILGVEFFKKALELQSRYADGKKIENSFQTNAVLLDDQWGEFLAEHNFLVGVSIDGPKELNDRYRVNKGGEGTFERALKGIETLKKHGVEFNTLTVVHRQNADYPRDVYRFLKEAGSGFMQLIPIVERRASEPTPSGLELIPPDLVDGGAVTEWSVLPEQYGKFLTRIFDEWVRKDVGRIFVQIFDVALESWYGVPQNLCVFTETCGQAMALEHNGDLYSCDHYVYPENRLGNIIENPLESLVSSEQQTKFGEAKRDALPQYCLKCDVRFACNGECPKHRFLKTPDGEEGLNYLCAGYKSFFRHIDPYMRFMASELREGRPPANVMRWAKK